MAVRLGILCYSKKARAIKTDFFERRVILIYRLKKDQIMKKLTKQIETFKEKVHGHKHAESERNTQQTTATIKV